MGNKDFLHIFSLCAVDMDLKPFWQVSYLWDPVAFSEGLNRKT